MFGQFAEFAGAVCVPLPPAAGADAAGAGLAALTTTTPPTAIIPTDKRAVTMSLRAPDMCRLATGVSGCVADIWGSVASIEVSLPFLNCA